VPLTGIKVLDFSRFLPGPYCTLLLADFGADVIRVEQPHEVAKHRQVFGQSGFDRAQLEVAKAKEISGRNKRSVLLDLRNGEALAAIKGMLAGIDVLVHDYRPGVMEEMGLGFDAVRSLNSRVVYCAISACGQSGPYRDLAGHDPIALALSGALMRFGATADEPHIVGAPVADITAGTHAAFGILAALRARDTSGTGQLVDVAMSDCAFALMTSVYQRALVRGEPPPLHWQAGNVGLWKTKDGKYLCTTDLEPRFWERFCVAIQRKDLIPRQFELSGSNSIVPDLEVIFLSKTRDQWFELLRRADCQVAPVYSLNEALHDPHHRARGTVSQVDGPHGEKITQIGPLVKLNSNPARIRYLARMPGADTRAVLKEFGVGREAIEKLTFAREDLN
jgi:crotonobetainyl-CoA:carnitine CoA-transferase CaiB-like acyl-CoA transferase